MKKLLTKVVLGVLVLLVLAVVFVALSLDRIIKAGVEKVGPQIAKVEMKLDKASISLLSGNGELSGLFIGNPEGFKTESAIKAGSVRVAVRPSSVFSDKIVLESITVTAPDITFEGGLTGNNLSKILANVEKTLGSGASKGQTGPSTGSQKKIQVNDFVISDGKIHAAVTSVLGSKSTTVPLPTIHLTNLGTGSEGITAAELSKLILDALVQNATKAVAGIIQDLGKGAVDAATEKATKGISDLFKKNK